MSEQEGLNPAERELEESLRSLAPAAARLDAVGAAFEAGRRSVRTQLRVWRMAAAAALLIGFGGWLVPNGAGVGNHMQVVAKTATPNVPLRSTQSVMMLQAVFRDEGLAGLPATDLPRVDATRASDWL